MSKKFLILVYIFAVVIQCSTKLEDKIDFSFNEKAKYDRGSYILAFSNKDIYPDTAKIYDSNRNLKIYKIFYSQKLIESLDIKNKTIVNVRYNTERGDPPISYEEACKIVREYQFDMRESITLEDCYGFWGKYARRLGFIDTRREY